MLIIQTLRPQLRLDCIKISVLVLRNCPTLPILITPQLKLESSGLRGTASADYFQGRLVPLDVRETNCALQVELGWSSSHKFKLKRVLVSPREELFIFSVKGEYN